MPKASNIAVVEDVVKKQVKLSNLSIRVSSNNYLVSLFLSVFFSSLLFYIEYNSVAVSFLFFAIVIVPFLYFNDKIVIKGETLHRKGMFPYIWSKLNGKKLKLKFSDIEQIETQSIRALKRSGTVFYRYRTSVRGNDSHLTFASGGEDYRNFVKELFPKVIEDVLDNRSIELRDYLADSKEILMKAAFAKIPSAEVLENSLEDFSNKNRKRNNFSLNYEDYEKSDYLRRLANELRITGSLLQSLETFRRALLITPENPWLIFEFSRCLSSYAGVEKSLKLDHRANAALRLAEIKTKDDSKLLARIGESYFQIGSLNRSRNCFQKSIDLNEQNFRSSRGLAEISLREGKIAHVIHHFGTAKRSVQSSSALDIWASNEIGYFSQLNSNEEYMEAEVQRINLLEGFRKNKSMSLRFSFVGFFVILFGNFTEIQTITNIGWTLSTISLIAWTIMLIGRNIFLQRIPIEVFDDSDDE